MATLSVPDILDLLPISVVAPGAKGVSWEALRASSQAPKGSTAFKKWMRAEFGFSDDDETIMRACSTLDLIPEDLQMVLRVIESAAVSG